MRRKDGYLDLDHYYHKIAKTKSKADLEKKGYVSKPLYTWHNLLDIDGVIYYFKDSNFSYREVIASYIAKDLGLNAVEYDMAIFDGEKGTISKYYVTPGVKYLSGADLIDDYAKEEAEFLKDYVKEELPRRKTDLREKLNSLDILWQTLFMFFPKCKNDIPKVMNDLSDLFAFKYLIGNSDATSHNFEIAYDGIHIWLCPIIDNEYSMWPENDGYVMKSEAFYYSENRKDNLKKYLMDSSSEYIDRFLELFVPLTEEYFASVIERVETEKDFKLKDDEKMRILLFSRKMNETVLSVLEELNIENPRRSNGSHLS